MKDISCSSVIHGLSLEAFQALELEDKLILLLLLTSLPTPVSMGWKAVARLRSSFLNHLQNRQLASIPFSVRQSSP